MVLRQITDCGRKHRTTSVSSGPPHREPESSVKGVSPPERTTIRPQHESELSNANPRPSPASLLLECFVSDPSALPVMFANLATLSRWLTLSPSHLVGLEQIRLHKLCKSDLFHKNRKLPSSEVVSLFWWGQKGIH